MDEGLWPEDQAADARVLTCSQALREEAHARLWQPIGAVLERDFELMDMQDVALAELPLVLAQIAVLRRESCDPAFERYLIRLAAFLAEAAQQGRGVTVSL